MDVFGLDRGGTGRLSSIGGRTLEQMSTEESDREMPQNDDIFAIHYYLKMPEEGWRAGVEKVLGTLGNDDLGCNSPPSHFVVGKLSNGNNRED